jgi:uncharacterized membrane protein YbhN (UPF0104 family)
MEVLLHLLLSTLVALTAAALIGLTPPMAGIAIWTLILCLAILVYRRGRRALLIAVCFQACFFSIFWCLAFSIAWMLTGSPASAAALATLFLIGWQAGFVLPFIPGGIGVREAVIVALGGALAPPAVLLGFAALTRLITLGGDLCLGLASYLLPVLSVRLKRHASGRQ